MNSTTSMSERIYRTLLLVYPMEFRATAEPHLRETFRAMYLSMVSATSGRWTGLLRLWVTTLTDLTVSAFSEWRARLGLRKRTVASNPSGVAGGGPSGTGPQSLQEFRIALRSLGRAPAFTLVSVAILGLGIGANTTIFSIARALYSDAPPLVQDPDRLVRIHRTSESTQAGGLGYPNYVDLRESARSFDGFMAYDPDGVQFSLADGDRDAPVVGWFVSSNYFDVLGVQPALGRAFRPEEEQVGGAPPVAVLSHELWVSEWASDPSVVGRTVSLNGHGVTIVGIAPAEFRGSNPVEAPPDLWIPIGAMRTITPSTCRCAVERVPGEAWYWLYGIARLSEGVSVEQANADLARVSEELERLYPEWNEGIGARAYGDYRIHPGQRSALGDVTNLLSIAALIVLLVSAVNLAMLLLARGSTKLRDTGVRLALGAGRGAVLRSVLAETTVICLAGAVVGLAIAFIGGPLVAGILPQTPVQEVRPQGSALLFAFGVALMAGWMAALVPGWQAMRTDVSRTMKDGGSGRRRFAFRNALVVTQVALSSVLVAGALLFGRSLMQASSVDLGFDRENRIVFSSNLANHGYGPDNGPPYVRSALESLQAMPGVLSVTTSTMLPFRGRWSRGIGPAETDLTDPEAIAPWMDVGFNAVGPNYFETLGIEIVAGREFTPNDDQAGEAVSIVNEYFAEQAWPGENPIGKRLSRGEPGTGSVVVGVVRNAKYYGIDEEPGPFGYESVYQSRQSTVRFVVHLREVNASTVTAVRDRLLQLDRSIAYGAPTTLDDLFASQLSRFRSAALLVSLFGGLALILSAVGLYGVLSYLVVQRTREIGIQVALGASRPRVRRAVVGRGMTLVVIGIVIGLVGAKLMAQLVTGFLFGVRPLDPVSLSSMVVILVAVAAVASMIPAARATGISPMVALRSD